jgi:hypothetical protein
MSWFNKKPKFEMEGETVLNNKEVDRANMEVAKSKLKQFGGIEFKQLVEEILPELDSELSLSQRKDMATRIFFKGIAESAAGMGDALSQEELEEEVERIKTEAGYS